MANWFTSTSPQHVLVQNLVMERVVDGRRYKLVNRRFVVEKRCGRVVEAGNVESVEALRRLLGETFRIEPPVPVEQIFARLGSS
jgi:N-hydroxyarylamine O-acetyltransferase